MFVTGGCRGNCCRAVRLHVAEPSHDATDEVWCFCPVTLTCTPAPAMLKPRTMHAAVTCLDRVYVIGGRTRGSRGGAPCLLEVTASPEQPCLMSKLVKSKELPTYFIVSQLEWSLSLK